MRAISFTLLAGSLGLAAIPVFGAIAVSGLTTKTTYSGSVTFSVPAEAGYEIAPQLDGVALPTGTPQTESRAGYHELFVTKTPAGGGTAETLTVQFIVRDAARPAADDGVSTWTPRPAVDAPAAALDNTAVSFITPAALLPGASFPLVIRLTEGTGGIAKLNATARVSDAAGRSVLVRLRRGAGAGAWAAPAAGPFTLTLHLGDRSFTRELAVTNPAAEQLAGTLAASRTFAAGSVVDVTTNVSVPAGMTLRFEPGCVVRLAAGVTVEVFGALEVAGTVAEPVLLRPATPAQAWGGFFLRGGAATATVTGAMLTGAGANQSWISANGFSAHKPEQPVFCFDAGTAGGSCVANLTDTWIVDNPLGQAGHGRNASVTFTRCLIQRTKTSGQYNGGGVSFLDSHAIEFPLDSPAFFDGDNDGFYLTNGSHQIRRSVIGWTKDDGIDCGGDPAATLVVEDCWMDSCFHEAFALSGDKLVTISGTVSINNGQGLECGYSNTGSSLARPDATATGSLIVGCSHGARYGDNYDWTYRGKLAVNSSLLLHNGADVFGFEWDSWTWRTADMTIENNVVTAPVARHPNNTTLDPASHAPLVAALLTNAGGPRGFAVVDRPPANPRADYGGSLSVHLDRPASAPVTIPWRILAKAAPETAAELEVAAGTLEFPTGAVFATLALPPLSGPAAAAGWVAVLLDHGPAAIATGTAACHFVDLPGPPDPTLVGYGSTWSYLADGSDQGTAWREPAFDATGWPAGPGQLGYGNGDEATIVPYVDADPGTSGTQKNATTYFRRQFHVANPAAFASLTLDLLYDDGGIVFLNGQQAAASSNMPAGEVAHNYYLGTALPGTGNAVQSFTIPATALTAGTNTLAVEIHQASASSSDISFDLRLVGNLAPPGAIESTTATLDGRLHWFWITPGVIPASSSNLHDWVDRPDLTSPIVIPPPAPAPAKGFFRLTLP